MNLFNPVGCLFVGCRFYLSFLGGRPKTLDPPPSPPVKFLQMCEFHLQVKSHDKTKGLNFIVIGSIQDDYNLCEPLKVSRRLCLEHR